MDFMRIITAIGFVIAWTIFIHATGVGLRVAAAMVAAGLLILLATDRLDRGDPL